jgi:hypothetical protein
LIVLITGQNCSQMKINKPRLRLIAGAQDRC